MPDYSIDELARVAGTNVRNVRAYQQRGLLPKPRREGRRNVYSEAHLTRLRVIAKLLARGYTLGNIDEMLSAVEGGADLASLLGLEQAIASPWSSEVPQPIRLDELTDWFGREANLQAVEQAMRLGLLRMEKGQLIAPSPRLLGAGAELVKAGVRLDVLLQQIAAVRDDVERIADRFVRLVVDEIFDVYGEESMPPPAELPRITDLVRRLRTIGAMVVDVELGRALEESIHTALGTRLARIAKAEERERAGKPRSTRKTKPKGKAEKPGARKQAAKSPAAAARKKRARRGRG